MLSTIDRTPLIPGTTSPPRILDRFASFVGRAGDGARRVRSRLIDFQRLTPVEMSSDREGAGEAFRWRPTVRFGLRSHAALACPGNSRVSYDVTLPPDASVQSSCAVAMDTAAGQHAPVEFEIRVRTQGSESSGRCTIDPSSSRFDPRWQALRVHAPESGPARIVLTTRLVDRGTQGDVRALWGDPRIETPRSATDLLAAVRSAVAESGLRGLWHGALPANSERLYRLWVREHEPSREALRAQRQWSLDQARLFTLITFVASKAAWQPRRTVDSLRQQSYKNWEWVVVVHENAVTDVTAIAARTGVHPQVRILGVPSSSAPAAAWNAGLREARGEFVALLDQHDALAPTALYEMAAALEQSPDCDLLYSDEDRLTRRDRRHEPHFKPDWSPERLLSSNYIGRLAMMRVALALAAGGFRNNCDGAEEWDLVLRLSRSGARIQRLPRCLYHRDRTDAASAQAVTQTVLGDHCAALGLPATVTTSAGDARVTWRVQGEPTVSIVIPNRNAAAILKQCVSGLIERTTYPRHELVIVDNGSTEPEVLDLYRSLEKDGRCRVVPFDRPFNFSAACNAGAAAARGDLLLFLNNDIEVLEPDWLDELIRWAQLPEIGIVGAKLLYPDRTIQHAGVVFGIGLVGHVFSRAPEGTSGLFGSPETYRNYLAVTGACQMIRKDVFQRLGGFDERFRISFSDVVLCLEARRAGYRVVYTPYARLIHHESYTRKRDDSPQDMELLARYLRSNGFVEDPYLHPELNTKSLVPAIRPPFDPVPRQVVHDYVERVLAAAAH